MLRYKTETRPGLVALYDIRPGNGAGQFLQPRSPHAARRAGRNTKRRRNSRRSDLVTAVVGLVEIGLEHLAADVEIGLVEVVRDVPADLAVFAPLQHDGVEERQHEHQRRDLLKRTVLRQRHRNLRTASVSRRRCDGLDVSGGGRGCLRSCGIRGS